MKFYRWVVVAALISAPVLFLVIVGSYHLYSTGWGFIVWWPMAGSLTLAYVLSWYWTRRSRAQLLPSTGFETPPSTWTERDRQAWRLVERHAANITEISIEQVADAQRNADLAVSLALEVARVYYPGANDPFSHLTLPEIVTCAELVSHDLNQRVNKYIPGSHLLTVNDWKTAKRAIDWSKTAMDASWYARAVINPINTGMQFLASKASGQILNRVQDNVLLWFHTAYIHELGRYLIELNSGRLKVGAEKYRDLMSNNDREPLSTALSIAILGQVKSGKSSLINSLLGERKAATDVLVTTKGATNYELRLPDCPHLTLVDTAGYGESGPTEREVSDAIVAAEKADLILMTCHARTAARQADLALFERLEKAFQSKPNLRMPPVILVLTHVDLLSPALEWSPPYDWKSGIRKKEVSIHEAVSSVQDNFQKKIAAAVPVCTANQKEWNIHEELLILMAGSMNESRGIALLKLLEQEGRSGAARKTVDQVWNAGREALNILWQSVKR